MVQRIGSRCEICGRYLPVDWAHIIPKSHSLLLRDDKRNGILACREHHDVFDQNFTVVPVSFLLKRFPRTFGSVLSRMKALDEHYYNRFISKHNLSWGN